MKKYLLYILFSLSGKGLFAQHALMEKPESSSYYVNLLRHAKDSLYNGIMLRYEAYLKENPGDINACIEKCRLMESAYYDEGEDYNPNFEACQNYLDSLSQVFPDEPELMIYKSEFLYGDSAIAYCRRVVKHFETWPDKWKGYGIWSIYKTLSECYAYDDKAELSIRYGLLAMANNDTLDFSLQVARQYKANREYGKGVRVLLDHLDSNEAGWKLNQKGQLLVDMGSFENALKVLKWARKDTSMTYGSNEALAKALIENGYYSEARSYLLKDTDNKWNSGSGLLQLFDYDLRYGNADSAVATYRRMNQVSFMYDPVGIKRIRLFIKAPWLGWTFAELVRPGLLLLAFLLLFLVPYAWILPIHYIGNYFRSRGSQFTQSGFRWSLRHFWYASAMLVMVDVSANLFFDHDNFFGIGKESEIEGVNTNTAHLTVFTFLALFLLTLLFFKKSDLKFFWGELWSKQKMILTGIGYAVLLRFAVVIYINIYNLVSAGSKNPSLNMSIVDNINAVNNYYHPLVGFLFVVIIVPFYEEVIFRGVFLSACEKYMRFFWANSIQAVLFAALHMDLKLFPFYLAFGYVAGYQRRKAEALAPGISMHMTNNFVSFLVILGMKGAGV